MIIKRITTKDLPTVIAGLVRQGLVFEAIPHPSYEDEGQIVITGY
jgi:hypothetical protein